MNTFTLVYRGCGYLPHVGSHPGSPIAAGLLLMGALGGGLYGAVLMACVVLPIYLYGAYDRAVLSYKIQNKKESNDDSHQRNRDSEVPGHRR